MLLWQRLSLELSPSSHQCSGQAFPASSGQAFPACSHHVWAEPSSSTLHLAQPNPSLPSIPEECHCSSLSPHMAGCEVALKAALLSVPLRLSVLSAVFHGAHQDPRKGRCETAAPELQLNPSASPSTELCPPSISFLTGSSSREKKWEAGGWNWVILEVLFNPNSSVVVL